MSVSDVINVRSRVCDFEPLADAHYISAFVTPPTRGRASVASQNGSAIKLTTLPQRHDGAPFL